MVFIKSYNHLFEKMISDENIRLAILHAGKNKYKNNKRHKQLRHMRANADEYIPIVREWILNFQPPKHRKIQINDGVTVKKREIIVPTVREIVVHHAMVNVLKPIICKGMYEHSYASIPGKGIHGAMKTVKRWIFKNNADTKYCLKLDIRKFFDSIDQDVLLERLKKMIRDKRYFEYIEKVVRTTDKGIPLGFVTSQWFANFILTELDHKIKEEYGVKYYVRFMDDMVLFGSNKRELHEIRKRIDCYLNNELHLQLKGNWQLFFMDSTRSQKKKGHFLDFLGFKFYRTHIGLRRKLALRIQRKAKRIRKKEKATIRDARQMVTYAGFVKYADCRQWFRDHVLKFVSIKNLRKKISKYDKKKGDPICGRQPKAKLALNV